LKRKKINTKKKKQTQKSSKKVKKTKQKQSKNKAIMNSKRTYGLEDFESRFHKKPKGFLFFFLFMYFLSNFLKTFKKVIEYDPIEELKPKFTNVVCAKQYLESLLSHYSNYFIIIIIVSERLLFVFFFHLKLGLNFFYC